MYLFIGTGFAAMGIAALLADHVVASFCAVLVCIGFYLDLCSIFRSLHTRKIVSPARVVLTNGVLAIHRDSWIRVLDSSARIAPWLTTVRRSWRSRKSRSVQVRAEV